MPKLFGNISDDPRMQKQALISRYSAARMNLLLMIVFSAVNILSLATGMGSYFLFSASIPYMIVSIGMLFCGMYPSEVYENMGDVTFLDRSLFVICLIIAILIMAIYFLCWMFSKKKKVIWLKIALVMLGIDTVFLFLNGGFSAIIDLIFHGWVIVILIMGIKAHKTLSNMPKESEFIEADFTELPSEEEIAEEPAALDTPDAEGTDDKEYTE